MNARTVVTALLLALAFPAAPGALAADTGIDPERFGERPPDPAYGAFQRGLYITALNLAQPRAEKGDAAAQALIAEIYSRGLGVARDEREAAKWYEKAALQGVPEAQLQYALMLMDGKYVEGDPDRAYALMEKAADSGDPNAQFNYAQMIMERESGLWANEKAVGYFQLAADSGLADAQYAMAKVYATGVGNIARDDKEARLWLLRAARQNYDTAQVELATWLVEGRGGERNLDAGFQWMRRAAQSGNVAAMNRLAKLYRNGIGTEGDSIEAAAWYVLARRAGLTDPELDVFMDGLTSEQVREAIQRANRLR